LTGYQRDYSIKGDGQGILSREYLNTCFNRDLEEWVVLGPTNAAIYFSLLVNKENLI
jgi:hypothetical protein